VRRKHLSRLITLTHMLVTMLIGMALATLTAYVVASLLSGSQLIAITVAAVVFAWSGLMIFAGLNTEQAP
jgi:hypothetical protein